MKWLVLCAALLLPSGVRADERSECVHQLRRIEHLIKAYVHRSGGALPFPALEQIFPMARDPKLFVCPADKAPDSAGDFKTSYEIVNDPSKLAKIDPGRIAVVVEKRPNHGGRRLVLFQNGAIRSFDDSQFEKLVSDAFIGEASVLAYELRSIRGYLYYQEGGKIDDRDLVPGKLALRNVLIGGGDAEAPSGAVLVLVDLSGPDFGARMAPAAAISITAEGPHRKTTTNRFSLHDFFSETGEISVPMIVYGTRCEDVKITARLEGLGPASSLQAVLPFVCGE